MKKYVVALALTLLFAVGITAGCGSTDTTAKKEETKTEAADKKETDAPSSAGFKEYPIGDEKDVAEAGIKVAAIYLQPVDMAPVAKAGLKASESDVHLEADISALANNPLGYGVGEFVHYLTVKYKLVHKDSGKVVEGSFMPMNAGDGSHYGANVKMMGAGNYTLTFSIDAPDKQDFLIHTDKATGVPGTFWNKPAELTWDFSFVPRKW
jgi:periplasmic iron binding protein